MPRQVYEDVRMAMAFSEEKLKKVGLFDTARCMVDLYCARPGQGQRPHVHEGEDKVFYVLEGTAEVTIGGETIALGPGGLALAPAGVEHGLTNPGPGHLVALVVIAPPIPH